jgi:hypothetical protein
MQYSTTKVHHKLVAILTVLAFLLQLNPVLASDICFTNISSARKSAADIDYTLKTQAKSNTIISLLKDENSKYFNLSNQYVGKITFLEKDKEILKKRGDDFEKVYTTCSKDLIDCELSKPSRFTWFCAGFLSAFILGVGTIYMIKK